MYVLRGRSICMYRNYKTSRPSQHNCHDRPVRVKHYFWPKIRNAIFFSLDLSVLLRRTLQCVRSLKGYVDSTQTRLYNTLWVYTEFTLSNLSISVLLPIVFMKFILFSIYVVLTLLYLWCLESLISMKYRIFNIYEM